MENMINVYHLWAIMVTIMVQPSEVAELALYTMVRPTTNANCLFNNKFNGHASKPHNYI